MSTTDKNFKVKNGLNVAGTATFESDIVLGSVPLAFDSNTNRLKVYINSAWKSFATLDDIQDPTQVVNFMDIGLIIDYNGKPVYIIQGNGVSPSGTSKFLDGGNPSTASTDFLLNSGTIAV